MRGLETAIRAISLWMARIGGAMLLVASLIITYEVLVRKLQIHAFNVGTELSSYALAVGASWAFSHALLQRAHVRVDIIRKPFGPAGRAVLDVLALVSLTTFGVVLCFYAGETAAMTWELGARENTPLATPLVIPQGLWFLGLVWFSFVGLEQTAAAIAALVRGRMTEVIAIAGPAETPDAIEEALSAPPVRIEGGR
jgi:TRAP-type mannitol/chloroaromatic compound transport system permease small subunit